MHTPYQPPWVPPAEADRPVRPRLTRPVEGRIVGGVCAGLAIHLRLDVRVVRLLFALGTLASGAGLFAYLFLWALTPQALDAGPRAAAGSTHNGTRPGARILASEAARNVLIGAALLVIGVSVVAQQRGINLRLGILLPVIAVSVGAVLAWSQLDDTERNRWLARGGADRPPGVLRLGGGIVLAIVGITLLASQGQGLAALWHVGVAAVAVLAGVALIATPWAVRLWRDLRDEQAERVRATERADIAAHLHDSVLQTLALIQRKADDPGEVARLARAQERELRGWLYAGPRGSQDSLAAAVTEVAHEVEDLHGVPIELVVTGDRPLDDGGVALVRALREALLNAARHGAPPVSAYVEVGAGEVEAFVRDHGPGFDPDAVPEDRLGVRESIIGRMTRHGGRARLRRLEDGTEVALALPVTQPVPPARAAGAPPEPRPDPQGARS